MLRPVTIADMELDGPPEMYRDLAADFLWDAMRHIVRRPLYERCPDYAALSILAYSRLKLLGKAS